MLLRSFGSRALAAGVVAIIAAGAWGGAGCSITKPTELVPGALSQIQVPDTLAGLRLQVLDNGQVNFDQTYRVVAGTAFLPATLGVIAGGSTATTVTVILAGYNKDGVNGPEFQGGAQMGEVDPTCVTNCTTPRVKRISVQTYVDQHTLFLPLQLSYACWGNDCSGAGSTNTQTCKANTCVTNATDPHTLVDFDPSLIDGTQDCFSPSTCFPPQTTTTAVLLDSSKCLYEVPPDQTAGFGINVRIIYQDLQFEHPTDLAPVVVPTSEEEILNEEPASALLEGYSIPDPSKPLQFQLAPGLCKLASAATVPPAGVQQSGVVYHTIGSVQVSTACPSKVLLDPICAAEQNIPTESSDGGETTSVVCDQPITLEPAPSAVYMVMDNSSIMAGAFGPQGYATAMGVSLGNPLFKRTYVAFDFLDHQSSDCTSGTTPFTNPGAHGGIEFGLASAVQPGIAGLLNNPTFADPAPDGGQPSGGFLPLDLEAAMRPQQGAFKHLADFAATLQSNGDELNVGAAIFFLNRQPDSTGTVITYLDGGSGMPLQPPLGQDCHPALDDAGDNIAQNALVQEIVAASQLGLQSYFVILNNSLFGIDDPLAYFRNVQALAKAQGVTTMQVIDATEPKAQAATVLSHFSNVAADLGTCLYEVPPGVGINGTLQFTLPIPTPPITTQAPAPVKVNYNASCTAATQGSGSGWNIEGNQGAALQHLRICGSDCANLRQSVQLVAAVTLTGGAADGGLGAGLSDAGASSIPEVPVTVTMPCTDAGM